jgi:hypothetical protein
MFEQKWPEVFNSAAYFISILFKLCLQLCEKSDQKIRRQMGRARTKAIGAHSLLGDGSHAF